MNLLPAPDAPAHIHVVEPAPEHCSPGALSPEGTGRTHACELSPPRARILELLRPGDPGRDALEAIVRPIPRRGLVRPFDEDTKRFLQRALAPPSERIQPRAESAVKGNERSLAEELREAEREELASGEYRRELVLELRRREGGARAALDRERLGRLALAVEEDEGAGGLAAAARRLDALLAESRSLHAELAGIHEDMQAQAARASRCAAAARALHAQSRALRYLDDVVALLRGDERAAVRARAWPFALGPRAPHRNYVV